MIPRFIPIVAAVVASLANAQDTKPAAEAPAAATATAAASADPFAGVRLDIVSYAIGNNFGKQMGEQGFKPDYETYVAGMKDGVSGAASKFSQSEIQEAMMKFQAAMQASSAQAGERAVADGKKFLETNGKKEGVKTTASGLQSEVLKAAEGPKPAATDEVTVHYRGTLITGKEFDSSYSRNEPTSFPLNQVIKGWTEGLQLMSVGSKFKFTIPSDLAYGENGPPSIGPNQVLVFEVELIKIGK